MRLEEWFPEFTPEYVKRFLSRLHPIPGSECVEWTGAKDPDGYGICRGPLTKSKVCKAHRISYWIFRGPLDDEATIEHICRNPPCVNPYHLLSMGREDNTALGNMERGGEEYNPHEDFEDIL